MVEYTCEKCSTVFNRKGDYDRHVKRKTDCGTEGTVRQSGGSKTNKKPCYSCGKCKRTFTRKDSLTKHTKGCKHVAPKKTKKKTKTKTKKSKVNIDANIEGDNNQVIGNNEVNHIENHNNTYIINVLVSKDFATDGIADITVAEISKILESNQNIFHSLIELVNFNPNKPQNHNVYLPDLKSATGIVYENDVWINKKINEIVNRLLDAKIDDLNEILQEMQDCLRKKSIRKIKEALENADYTNIESRKKLVSYLKLVLYNNKDMIIKTRDIMEGNEVVNYDAILKKGKTKEDFAKCHKKMCKK